VSRETALSRANYKTEVIASPESVNYIYLDVFLIFTSIFKKTMPHFSANHAVICKKDSRNRVFDGGAKSEPRNVASDQCPILQSENDRKLHFQRRNLLRRLFCRS